MTKQEPIMVNSSNADWWRGAVIYQIYPRSFQDSTGDGIGDLRGITQRLGYIKSLGVDAIWISPFFKSPMKDFGYDVSDYRDIDPMFGTLDDFDRLIETAHDLGLKILIDLVLSHSSDQHEWFKESRSSRENDKANWYVWSDPKPDGTPPNNWLSIFGGAAWTWDTRREQYYMHNFLTSQPDLNFHEPAVQDALLDVTRFWLDRGVDGFRLDTINFYFADKELRSNPALPPEMRNSTIAPSVNPYNHQEHLFSKNQPENLEFLARFRAVLDEYEGRTAVGEVGDAQRGLQLMGEYTKGDTGVHMCYAFEFLEQKPLTAARIVDVMEKVEQVASEGWACWAFSNHDVQRHASRWGLSDQAARTYANLLMTLKGSACIYQGEELGLKEGNVAFEDLQDPYGIQFWPEFKGRDGCRTPMVWQNSNQNGGFSDGKPWLPVDPDHLTKAVAAQDDEAGSILNHYRELIAFRRQHAAFKDGEQVQMHSTGDVLSFIRKDLNETILCIFNLSQSPIEFPMPEGTWHLIGEGISEASRAGASLMLPAWQSAFAVLEG